MNKIILIGRVTNDILLKQSDSQKKYTNFTIAVNRNVKNSQGVYEADFISCVAFGKTAETLNAYVKKGDKLGLEGSLQVSSYKNKEGKNVYSTNVMVEKIEFIEQKKVQKVEKTADPFEMFSKEVQITEEDLPFN